MVVVVFAAVGCIDTLVASMRLRMAAPSKGAPTKSSETWERERAPPRCESELRSLCGAGRVAPAATAAEAVAALLLYCWGKSPAGKMGDGLERPTVEGGCRGDELFDAFDVGVRAGGALGTRFRLAELRLLWIDWASIRPSMLRDEW